MDPSQDSDQKQQLVERLKSATNVLVTVSTSPSIDQLSACIGLTLLLNKLDKHATAVFSGPVPSTLQFLQPDKTIEKNTDSLRDFIISLDKSKADKLRYKVEENVVKIFITPYHTSISERDLDFSQGDFNVEVVVALGVHERDQLDQAILAHGRILHDATVVTLTAGSMPSTLGTINWQEPSASSLSEMLVAISEAFQPGSLDNQMATAFLTGIVAETERFSNQKTTPKVMTMAAQLMAAGANQQLIATELKQELAPPAAEPIPEAPAPAPAAASSDGSLSIAHEGEEPGKTDSGMQSLKPAEDTASLSIAELENEVEAEPATEAKTEPATEPEAPATDAPAPAEPAEPAETREAVPKPTPEPPEPVSPAAERAESASEPAPEAEDAEPAAPEVILPPPVSPSELPPVVGLTPAPEGAHVMPPPPVIAPQPEAADTPPVLGAAPKTSNPLKRIHKMLRPQDAAAQAATAEGSSMLMNDGPEGYNPDSLSAPSSGAEGGQPGASGPAIPLMSHAEKHTGPKTIQPLNADLKVANPGEPAGEAPTVRLPGDEPPLSVMSEAPDVGLPDLDVLRQQIDTMPFNDTATQPESLNALPLSGTASSEASSSDASAIKTPLAAPAPVADDGFTLPPGASTDVAQATLAYQPEQVPVPEPIAEPQPEPAAPLPPATASGAEFTEHATPPPPVPPPITVA